MIAIRAPYAFFADIDGSPLDGGCIYFGEPHQNPMVDPVTVYWDIDEQLPAAQPVRTVNGFMARNGTPTQVFAHADYSMMVRNRRGRLVFYAPTMAGVDSGAVTLGNWTGFTTTGTADWVEYELDFSPGTIWNMDVSVEGESLVPNIDYTLNGLTFRLKAPFETEVLVRYGHALPQGITLADSVKYDPLGTYVSDSIGYWQQSAITATVNIPGDYPSLQAAVDAAHKHFRTQSARITLNIQAGHALTAPLLLEHGDYSNFRIVSEDATVTVAPGLVGTPDRVDLWLEDMNAPGGTSPYKALICLRHAKGPRLACKIDANGHTGFDHGIAVMHQSSMITEPNCGLINSSGRNVFVLTSSYECRYAKHSGAVREGIRARESYGVVWDDADFSNCGDSTDPAVFMSRGTIFYGNRAIVTGAGGNAIAVHRSFGSVEEVIATGAGALGLQCDTRSVVSAAGADFSNSGIQAIQCARSTVDARNAIFTGCNSGGQALEIIFGGELTAETFVSAVDVYSIANIPPNLPTADGMFVTSKSPAYSPLRLMGVQSDTGASNGKRFDSSGILKSSRNGSGAQTHSETYNTNGLVGTVSTSGSATAYNTSSDETLKDFTGPYDPERAIAIIEADPVRAFTWKSTGQHAVGWGAQTSYAVSQDLATPGGWVDPKTGDSVPEGTKGAVYRPWGIDQGKRTPYLWAAVAFLIEEVRALRAAGSTE